MKKSIVWAAVAIIICTCLIIYGCSSGNKSNSSGSANPLRVLAKNVIFGSSTANAATMRATGTVDTTTQVLAQNVVVDTANNNLTSSDLQSALDNEMAIKLSAYLPGTSWTVTNKTSDSTYSGTQGVITFQTGTFTINSGRLAVAGVGAASDNFCSVSPLDPISYELLSDAVMYLTWTGRDSSPQDATITVIARSKDKIILVGTGGCGFQGIPRISILTKVP